MLRRIAQLSLISQLSLIAMCHTSFADDSTPSPATSYGPHGGMLHAHGKTIVELVESDRTFCVYLFDGNWKPVAVKGSRGRLSLQSADDVVTHHYDLFPATQAEGETNCLKLTLRRPRDPEKGQKVSLRITGLSKNEPDLKFSTLLRVVRNQDALNIRRQRTCPVSGRPLGSHGYPVKVATQESAVYVCCTNCVAFVD